MVKKKRKENKGSRQIVGCKPIWVIYVEMSQTIVISDSNVKQCKIIISTNMQNP